MSLPFLRSSAYQPWRVHQAASEQQGIWPSDLHRLERLRDYLTICARSSTAGAAQVLHHEGPYEGTMAVEQEVPAHPMKPSSYLECGSGWLQQDELYW